ncbi:hypothetical protein DVH24_029378 [Malus domestica]|uniref:Uncharacterized protein n=1 Tax=Malus domestica TaxID=3750 RepID=A0A498HYJ5_MALDO|nr:hypothetical protein DVH24_029378 [Malus domestica]
MRGKGLMWGVGKREKQGKGDRTGTRFSVIIHLCTTMDRCVARLQELQYTVSGGTKVISGVSLSPGSSRGYLRASLRCKQETARIKGSAPRKSHVGKFPAKAGGHIFHFLDVQSLDSTHHRTKPLSGEDNTLIGAMSGCLGLGGDMDLWKSLICSMHLCNLTMLLYLIARCWGPVTGIQDLEQKWLTMQESKASVKFALKMTGDWPPGHLFCHLNFKGNTYLKLMHSSPAATRGHFSSNIYNSTAAVEKTLMQLLRK